MGKKPPSPDLPDIEKSDHARSPSLTEDLALIQRTDGRRRHTRQRNAERPSSSPAATEKDAPKTPTKRENAASDVEDHTKMRKKFSDDAQND